MMASPAGLEAAAPAVEIATVPFEPIQAPAPMMASPAGLEAAAPAVEIATVPFEPIQAAAPMMASPAGLEAAAPVAAAAGIPRKEKLPSPLFAEIEPIVNRSSGAAAPLPDAFPAASGGRSEGGRAGAEIASLLDAYLTLSERMRRQRRRLTEQRREMSEFRAAQNALARASARQRKRLLKIPGLMRAARKRTVVLKQGIAAASLIALVVTNALLWVMLAR
jgi:hypothetical protein